MALTGLKVIEIQFMPVVSACSAFLADFGATVIRISRNDTGDFTPEGKLTLPLDLRNPKSKELICKLVAEADVLLESLRPGNMEKYGLGPKDLQKINPRLIYARLIGFGQTGPYRFRSGHDGTFASVTGLLSMLGDPIGYPSYMMSFSSSALLCAYSILSAVIARDRIGVGQVIDHTTAEATAYAASALYRSRNHDIWCEGKPCFKMNIYETKDGRFMSVMSYEKRYFLVLKQATGLENDPEFHYDCENAFGAAKLTHVFKTKTQKEWTEIFSNVDACVSPVLDVEEAIQDEHNQFRNNFTRVNGLVIPNPAPKLELTPAVNSATKATVDAKEQVRMVLDMIKVDEQEMEELIKEEVILL